MRWTTPLTASRQSQAGLVSDGTTVFTTESGEVQALDVTTGRSRWRRQLGQEIYGAWLHGGTVVVSVDQVGPSAQVVGLDVGDGTTRWIRPIPGGLFAAQVMTSDGGLAVLEEAGAVAVIDATSGAVRWSAPIALGHALDAAGTVVLAAAAGVLRAFNDVTGAVVWRVPFDPQASPLAAGTVVTDHGDSEPDPNPLTGYDAATGAVRWTLPLPGSDLRSEVVTSAGLVVTARDGSGGVLELVDPRTGAVRWRAPTTVVLDPQPVIADGELAAAVQSGSTGSLAAWRLADGQALPDVPLPGPGFLTAARAGGGVLLATAGPPGGAPGELVDIAGGRVEWTVGLPALPDHGLVALPDGGAAVQVSTPAYGCAL